MVSREVIEKKQNKTKQKKSHTLKMAFPHLFHLGKQTPTVLLYTLTYCPSPCHTVCVTSPTLESLDLCTLNWFLNVRHRVSYKVSTLMFQSVLHKSQGLFWT